MDLNQLTRDADDLIRKVVSRYNQLYVPAGNISQLELDLMLDDMRKLYDTFKIIGQVNLTIQHNSIKQEVSVNTAVQSDLQHKATTSQTHDVMQRQTAEPATSEPEPEPEFDTEPEPRAEPDDETVLETTLIPEEKEPVFEEKEPEPNAQTKPVIEPAPEKQAVDKSDISESEIPVQSVSELNPTAQNPEPSRAMLADKFNAGNKSLSETMASSQKQGVVGSRLLFHPITDLSTGIGLNDKFSFISELFGNNPLQYDEAINRINKAVNADEANWILQKYHTADWEQKQETLARMKDFVKRRFI